MSENVTLKAAGFALEIDPHGAEMQSLRSPTGRELLWQGNPAVWPDRAPILFPVIGPLVGSVFRHGGREYPMPPHGFAHLSDFTVTEREADHCVFELRDSRETRRHYPFAFTLRVEYRLVEDGLRAAIVVENRSSEPMPADIGFHPGLQWPLEPDAPKESHRLVFEKDEPAPIRRGHEDPILLYPEPRPTPVEGDTLRLRDALFEDQAIVWDRLNSRALTYIAPGGTALRVGFPDSPHLGLWMRPGATYICIEPWQGLPTPDDFEGPFLEKPGTAVLAPGETRRWRLEITLKSGGG